MFDLYQFKQDIVDCLKQNLCPENTIGTLDFQLNSTVNMELAQSFKPFSTVWRENRSSFEVQIYARKTGNPTGSLCIDLYSSYEGDPSTFMAGTTIPPESISTSYSWIKSWIDLSGISTEPYLGSNTEYWLKIYATGTPSTLDYYEIRYTPEDPYWFGLAKYRESGTITWNTLAADLTFKVSVPTWIYPDFPKDNLSLFSFPRIAVDITGRPRVFQRWIDHRVADYELNLAIIVYSRYPREMDDLLSGADRSLWKDRITIPSFRVLNPGNISSAVVPREGLFARVLTIKGIYRELGY